MVVVRVREARRAAGLGMGRRSDGTSIGKRREVRGGEGAGSRGAGWGTARPVGWRGGARIVVRGRGGAARLVAWFEWAGHVVGRGPKWHGTACRSARIGMERRVGRTWSVQVCRSGGCAASSHSTQRVVPSRLTSIATMRWQCPQRVGSPSTMSPQGPRASTWKPTTVGRRGRRGEWPMGMGMARCGWGGYGMSRGPGREGKSAGMAGMGEVWTVGRCEVCLVWRVGAGRAALVRLVTSR